jgi:hypothetical protein
MANKVADMIAYIKRHVDDLLVSERQDILQIVMNSPIEDKKIQTKGNGTQIRFKDLDQSTILTIYTYIQTKLQVKMSML